MPRINSRLPKRAEKLAKERGQKRDQGRYSQCPWLAAGIGAIVSLTCAFTATAAPNAQPETTSIYGASAPEMEVRIGAEPDFPPYTYIDSDGQPTGFTVDLMTAIARHSGLRVKYVVNSWAESLASLDSGEVDTLALARSAGRARTMDFSDPFITTYDAIFVRDDEREINSQADLVGKRLIVEDGDFAQDYLAAEGHARELIATKTPAEALKLLSAGRGDAVIISQIVGLVTLNRLATQDAQHAINVRLARQPYVSAYKREFVWATAKNRPELINRVNDGLKSTIDTGEYERIYKKWFAVFDPETKRLEETRRQLLFGLLVAIGAALISGGLVLVFKRQVKVQMHEIAESERRFRSLVENMPGVVYRMSRDPQGHLPWRMEYISDPIEQITGYPAADFIDTKVRQIESITHPEDLALFEQVLSKVKAQPGRYVFDMRVIAKNGEMRWLHARGRSTPDASGRVVFIDGIFLDITQQKTTSDLLTQQQTKMAGSARLSALGEMAGGIAHEINNPLAIINLRVHQLLLLAEAGDVRSKEALAIGAGIESTALRISKIIKSLQTVARESERDPFEEVSIRTIVLEAFELCYQRMLKHGIIVTAGDVPDDLFIECRRVQISQVLINLLNNAFDAIVGENERWIRLSARPIFENGRACVELSITDSGRGLSRELGQKIFQPFFTTKPVGKGTGLGLSISKGLIEAHDGSIWLDAEAPTTRFVIVLPKRQSRSAKEDDEMPSGREKSARVSHLSAHS